MSSALTRRARAWIRAVVGPSSRAGRGRAIAVALTVGLALAAGLGLAVDRLLPPPEARMGDLSVTVTDAQDQMLRSFLASDGIWRLKTGPRGIDQRYLAMLIAYEDQRFRSHWGVDGFAAARAVLQLARAGRVVSGASTLTMQTARLLAPDAAHRGLGAKLRQVLRAIQLEARYTKDDILGRYLTLAPFGGNLEGVRAASLSYFGKEPKALTLAQAALLVALPQSPERLRPDRHPEAARAGRDKVLARLAGRGVIGWSEAREAMNEPVPAARRPLPFVAPHLAERLAAGAAPGAVVPTGIDGPLQLTLEQAVAREQQWAADGANVAVLVVENETRLVRAYVANADFWGRAGQVDLARSVRSPGSALKPFAYAMAFDDLVVHPETLIEDRPTVFGGYAPRNFDRDYQGTVPVRAALQLSLNVPAVAVFDRVGPSRFVARLDAAGVRLQLPPGAARPSLPVILGGVGTTLTDLATLYVGLAHGGKVAPLRFNREDPVDVRAVSLFGPVAAFYVLDILRDSPLPDGWTAARGLLRRPVAFKTGTSYGFRDAWAIGVSPRYTVAVWLGRPEGSTRPGAFGRNAAAPLMLRVFDALPAEAVVPPGPPPNSLSVSNAQGLPRVLRYFRVRPKTVLAAAEQRRALTIAFPPDGATVALSGSTMSEGLALRAVGGQGRLLWLVDGAPLDRADGSKHALWRPAGAGFARLTVIDSAGGQASATVRLTARD